MNIGEVADRSDIPPKTSRSYEDIGLVRPLCSGNGYRALYASDRHKLACLGRARGLGFSIQDCRILLGPYEDDCHESAQVKAVLEGHLTAIDGKVAQLGGMRETRSRLAEACRGDQRPDCPTLKDLSGDQT